MRGSLAAFAAVLVAQSLAPACLAQAGAGPPLVLVGKVSSLNPVTMNFVCRGRGGAWRYWVTRATRFRAGPHNASFYDLRTGQPVEVMFHDSGRLEIADRVILLP